MPIIPSASGLLAQRHFRYPENLGQPPVDKWILFEAKAGRHILRNNVNEGGVKDDTVSSVALYLPDGALKSGIDVAWEKAEFGPFMGTALELMGQNGENLFNTNLASAADLSPLIQKVLTAVRARGGFDGNAAEGNTPAGVIDQGWAVLKGSMGIVDDAIKADMLRHASDPMAILTGQRVNSKTDMLFSSHEFRSHDFEFLLAPRNEREAKAIDNIIKFFQFYMLPSFGQGPVDGSSAFMIGFPYEFTVKMHHGSDTLGGKQMTHINQIGRSVIKTCNVDHAAGGKVSFIKSGNEHYPVATKLSLRLQEVRLLDRADDEIKRPGTVDFFDSKLAKK